MANRFQKMLFNLSTLSPIAMFFSIVWWIQNGTTAISMKEEHFQITATAILITVIGLVGFLYAFRSIIIVKRSEKKLEVVPISVSSVKSKGNFPVAAIIAYILPFSNLVISEYNVWLTLVIILIALVFVFLSNSVLVNPLLLLSGYHFYEIATENGSEELPMISTRESIQDAKRIKKVITVWDYFLIEVK